MPKPYPLDWPKEKPRTPVGERRRSPFSRLNWDTILKDLQHEVDALGGSDLVLSTAVPTRLDGRPRGEYSNVMDPGVAVYFTLEKMPVRLACDQWLTVKENIRAICLHLESMRGQERWGVGTKKQAFSGYSGLTRVNAEAWRIVLGLPRQGVITRDDIIEAHRKLMIEVHPDHGGSQVAAARVNEARDRALDEVR